ncbi:MAG: HD domain-containing phosphohydrolase [Candidatus Limnocylindria bacterium]
MNKSVSRLIFAILAAAVLTTAAAYLLFPVRSDIGGVPGITFWIVATLVASAMPVRLPRGTVVSVAAAPLIAAMVLGGPVAGALVAAIGTTESRELRGQVPWYGTVYNHAANALPIVLGGIVFEAWLRISPTFGSEGNAIATFLAALISSSAYLLANWFLTIVAVSARTGVPMRTVWSQDVSGVAANLVGLAPVGWLMAQVFLLPDGVGWWATALFVVPLFTTRLAYARYVETRELFEQTIGALANAVDARDRYTRGHSNRVSHISEAMGRVMRLAESEIEKIKWAGLLHDVGKIGIRDNILLKEGPLDREERILMNQHPTIGAEIVAPATQLAEEAPLIRAHHEWFNGSGYPDGLEAIDIPLGARIMTIADAYEAMTSSRPYRKTPLTHEQAVAELEKYTGIQFDPRIVPVLIGLDRGILDRPPDRPDELPTMLHQPDPRDRLPGAEPIPAARPRPAPTSDPRAAMSAERREGQPQRRPHKQTERQKTTRPLLASDDVS